MARVCEVCGQREGAAGQDDAAAPELEEIVESLFVCARCREDRLPFEE